MTIQEWVRPFIKKKLKGSFTKEYPISIIDNLDDASLCLIMTQLFQILDMTIGFLKKKYIIQLGEIICRLPRGVFIKLYKRKLIFLIPSIFGASSIKLDINSIVLFIPLATFRRSKPIFIGEIVHELAHIYAGHLSLIPENLPKYEKEADKIAGAWGFKKEIIAMNKEIRSIKASGMKNTTHNSQKKAKLNTV